jgi:hypothetical protein
LHEVVAENHNNKFNNNNLMTTTTGHHKKNADREFTGRILRRKKYLKKGSP